MRSPRGPPTRREHRFLCQRKRWERKRRGGAAPSALLPMRNRAKFPLRWDCASPVPFEPSFPPMRKALYCHARQVTAKTISHRKKWGGPIKRPPFWRGVERGTRSSPLRLFFPRFLFREKKSGPRWISGLCGEHKTSRRWERCPFSSMDDAQQGSSPTGGNLHFSFYVV